jgi:thiol:disulfide interchange protein
MTETLSARQLRLVVLLGLVVVLGGAYWMLVARHHSSTPAPSKSQTHSSTPTKFATHGLPVAVAQALRKHSVVVVALYSPRADVDQLASAEARAGAVAMSAGFVNLDVFRQKSGTAILRKLGVMDTPAVLVVKRPYGVYADFKGFVDRSVVEQAVADARG